MSIVLHRGPELFLVQSQEEFDAVLHQLGAEPSDWMPSSSAHACTHTLARDDGRRVAVVALGDMTNASPTEVNGLLVHEAVHVFQNHCESIGETNPSTEFQAYGIQAVAQWLFIAHKRKTRTPSKASAKAHPM